MMHLQLLQQPTFMVDATVSPPQVAKRIEAILEAKVFKVGET